MKVLVIVVALLASAVASHLHSANMQWQAKQQEEAQNYRPSDVPKLAQHEYYNMGDSDNQDMQSNQEQEMEVKADDVASQNMHSAHNMQWQAVKQRKGGEEQLEKQAHPSDIPNLAEHEYYNNNIMGDSENQDMMQSEDEQAMEQFAHDEVNAVDDDAIDGPSEEPSFDEKFAEVEALSLDEYGFQRVYLLDMTKSNQQCPKELLPKNYGSLRLCGKRLNGNGCSSIRIPVGGRQYSQVRGRVVAYQYASTDAFNTGTDDINRAYVDGISITYGKQNQRKHVWTFGVSVFPYSRHGVSCPGTGYGHRQPDFVGDNYFCSSGNVDPNKWAHRLYDIPLWSTVLGDCGTHCNKAKDVPFFCRKLPETTREDLEFRICSNQHLADEDTQVQSIELYIK